ncbi:MAG TPA: hypothetical protein DCQ50_14200 [Chryseobacterium sp.]|nr:hypothetical protein [Chryseobacterium sp.]
MIYFIKLEDLLHRLLNIVLFSWLVFIFFNAKPAKFFLLLNVFKFAKPFHLAKITKSFSR